jgi:DNA-directed RNA polymerase subunit alpha
MLVDSLNPKVERIDDGSDPRYGKFVIEPLERGYGATIGSSLRRVLLSSIQGAAVTNVRIEGVLHEFSTIPGVVEDTTELLLNVKELALRIADGEVGPGDEPYRLRIERKGRGELTAADIETPPEVEVVNRDLHLATLDSPDASLAMELEVERGTGYVPAGEREGHGAAIGTIPVDAVFGPVRKVGFRVEPTRVGHLTDFDRLILEVTTNGTISPADAISEAAKILDRYLILFFDFAEQEQERAVEELDAARQRTLEMSVESLDFSVRTSNCLRKEQIRTVGELVARSEDDLMRVRNFGRKSLDEVKEKLATLGMALAPSSGEPREPLPDEPESDDEEEAGDEA